MAIHRPTMSSKSKRWAIVGAMVVVAFFASYTFALAKSAPTTAGSRLADASPIGLAPAAGTTAGPAVGGGGCCGAGGGAPTAAPTAPNVLSDSSTPADPNAQAAVPVAGGGGCCGGGGGCCGGGAQAPAASLAPKAAEIAGGVQKISVDVSKGYYDPGTIELKAGVPAEITFSQASGCTGYVQSQELGFSEDLSSGPKTVKLPALTAGSYSFACGMNMVFGTVIVK